jgi:hypothetical protein
MGFAGVALPIKTQIAGTTDCDACWCIRIECLGKLFAKDNTDRRILAAAAVIEISPDPPFRERLV